MSKSAVLLTGAAGFIGAKTVERLLERGEKVVGIDNLNDHYDVSLKRYRLKNLERNKNFTFHKLDIENLRSLRPVFSRGTFKAVINLAARAGVCQSLKNPHIYFSTNVQGTLNLLELCREHKIRKFILASSSSLYAGQKMPFKETLPVNTPVSPYAASKKAAEVMCYSYHYLYGIDVSILRYFTVYGPAGRPDMSPYRFIQGTEEGKKLEIFGDGSQRRDFTYVDDIVDGTVRALKKVGFEIINLGGGQPHTLSEMIALIEKHTGKIARITKKHFRKADMKTTWADVSKARKVLGWHPRVSLDEGIRRSVLWWEDYKKPGNYDPSIKGGKDLDHSVNNGI